jgi:hypothetical protein
MIDAYAPKSRTTLTVQSNGVSTMNAAEAVVEIVKLISMFRKRLFVKRAIYARPWVSNCVGYNTAPVYDAAGSTGHIYDLIIKCA